MPKRVFADADSPTYAQIAARREQDRAFLAWLRAGPTEAELLEVLSVPRLPKWRVVALKRALSGHKTANSGDFCQIFGVFPTTSER